MFCLANSETAHLAQDLLGCGPLISDVERSIDFCIKFLIEGEFHGDQQRASLTSWHAPNAKGHLSERIGKRAHL